MLYVISAFWDFFIVSFSAGLCFLLGGIPSSVWVGLRWYGKDVRAHGSRNPGATNTFRVLGARAGTVVILLDISKALLAALWPVWYFNLGLVAAYDLTAMQLLYGGLAVLGHVFSVFLNFKGGKGVATLLGMLLAIHPAVVGLCVLVFLVVWLGTHYVSLGSIVATLCFPLLLLVPAFGKDIHLLLPLGIAIVLLVLYTHRANIGRLLKGEENKTYLKKRA